MELTGRDFLAVTKMLSAILSKNDGIAANVVKLDIPK